MEPINQHDACDDCGKRTDGLMTCTYSHDGSTTKLCPDCIKDSGFCLRCGYYCSGIESFDTDTGYCFECGEDDDDDDDDWHSGWIDEWDDDFDQWNEDNNPNDSQNL